MNFMTKHQILSNVIVVILAFAFATTGFSDSANSARIIPNGKVSIIKNGKVIGEFSKEAPLPEGSLLRSEAKVTVKLNDLYAVTEPDTVFSVKPMATRNELTVKQGTAYFSVSETSRPLEFNSPAGNARMRGVSVTGSELRGYERVSGSKMEIGVIDGGTMMVQTASGEMAITPGKQVTVALVDPTNPAAPNPATGAGGGSSLITDVALGAAGVGVLVAGGYALTQVGGSNGSDGSPSSP